MSGDPLVGPMLSGMTIGGSGGSGAVMVQPLGSNVARPLAITVEEAPKPVTELDKNVEAVIAGARKIAAPDRARVRDAMNAADKPLAGREGADHALGRAIGRPHALVGLRSMFGGETI